MDIGKAITAMKDGKKVKRQGWSDKTVAYLVPGSNSQMDKPYLYETNGGDSVPWCASHQELLATDWIEV